MRNATHSFARGTLAKAVDASAVVQPPAAALPADLFPLFILPCLGADAALLARLLDHHPKVHALAEPLEPGEPDVASARKRLHALAEHALHDASMSIRRGIDPPLRAVCRVLAPRRDEPIDHLLTAFPVAMSLCLLRDGRDAVIADRLAALQARSFDDLSRSARAAANAAAAFCAKDPAAAAAPAALFCPESLRLHTLSWMGSLCAPFRATELLGDRARIIRHEDLVAETIRTHAGTCRWLGIAGDSAHIHSAVEAARPQLAAAQRRGTWRTLFTESDKAAFKRMAGELLVELGYERDTGW